ncbi:MAG: response regulator [Acaryochloris sp. RU_4_1]|nr:response regulator [Acaryochloris sp. SU_5_25]NJM65051.1 response regulator [Acaryochloris sp. RU_4_1]NJR53849.1 response regulator [Acaryochloris sp. CRU_2_0]
MENSLKILVVDDDEVDRMAVRRALKTAGVLVDCAETCDATATLATLKTKSFDCIFLDYRLPDQDGLSLVQAIRELGIQTPLIVLTGQGDEQIAVNLMKAGASDYLAKSKISPGRLAQMLRNAIRVYQAEQQTALATQRLQESHDLLLRKNQELEQQRQQIHAQNLQLIEAAQIKSRFLATLSHELKTPLNAILGFSQMLLRPSKGTLSVKQTEMVQRILNNGKHLLEMLTEILDFSRIEAGRLDLNPEWFNLAELIAATLEELRSLADQKQLTLSMHFSLGNPTVFNDPGRVRQILTNLLSNAIKFTEAGQIWVKVKENSPEQLVISIDDTGIGIPPAELTSIFEAFCQVDQTNTRKHPGTGLGLAITRTLVEMMSGQITVTSQVGEGSTFRIEIPRQVS